MLKKAKKGIDFVKPGRDDGSYNVRFFQALISEGKPGQWYIHQGDCGRNAVAIYANRTQNKHGLKISVRKTTEGQLVVKFEENPEIHKRKAVA